MSNSVFFVELLLFHGLVLGWAIWEYRKTSALHKKSLEEEHAKALEAQESSVEKQA